jgi:hypothetical protein
MESVDNVYYEARRRAALKSGRLASRERAAEMLGLSTASLANYELGVTKTVPPDSVVMMADLYNSPELKYHYCSNECPIGQGMPIPQNNCKIEQIAVRVIKTLSIPIVEEIKDKLLVVLEDGKLTDSNEEAVTALVKYADNLTKTLGELRLACHRLMADAGIYDKRL